jgi:glycosyltransferase involved in cell wall biosynthesis
VDILYINGKFTAQACTGVQRVATSLLLALDRQLAVGAAGSARVVLLVPPGASVPALQRIEVAVLGARRLPLHAWEQGLLPWAARHGRLLNLAGAAPLLAARQACLLHDAAVFDRPQAYTAAFRGWYRSLFWLLPRRGAQLLTVSAFSRRQLARHLGVEPGCIGLVPNAGGHLADVAADAAVLARLGLTAGGYFLAVGSANPNKNTQALRAAFAELPSPRGTQLVIVGAADRRVFAASPPGAAAAADRVVQAGPVSDAELKALYQHAIALVFPSLYEGFGLPPLEAMACGCPVLAADAAAIPEVCGEAALYVDPTSKVLMAAAMQRLLDQPALRRQLADAGLQRSRQFDWDRSAGTLLVQLGAARLGGENAA